MTTYDLAFRITDFLHRQIAWSRTVVSEIDEFCAEPEDEELDAIVARQRQREVEIRAMAREYNGLAREWAADSTIADDVRAAIGQLSEEAETSVVRVRERYALAEGMVERLRSRHRESVAELRRGRRYSAVYKSEILPPPGFIDKDA